MIISSLVTGPEDGALHIHPTSTSAPGEGIIARVAVGQPFTVMLTLTSETAHTLCVRRVALAPVAGVEQLTTEAEILAMVDGGRAPLTTMGNVVLLLAFRCAHACPSVNLGNIEVHWSRFGSELSDSDSPPQLASFVGPSVRVESEALTCSIVVPTNATVGQACALQCAISNNTASTKTVVVGMTGGDAFAIAGVQSTHVAILPSDTTVVRSTLIPFRSGYSAPPTVTIATADGRHQLVSAVSSPHVFVHEAAQL